MNAPYDGRFKILAEDYPDLLLRLFGILEPGTKPQFIDILRELHLEPVQVDHVYRIVGRKGERLVHFEAITSWSVKRTSRLALYCFLLGEKYDLPIDSYAVLMARKYAPKELPRKVVYEGRRDGLRIEAPYKVIRLWEIDPSLAFEPGCEALLPWVPLLKGGAAEFEKAVEEIERLAEHPEDAPYPVPVMVSNIAILAGLRYDKDVISHFLERVRTKIMLDTELFVDTFIYKDGVAAGEARGEARGEAKGKRATVRFALKLRFPDFGPLPEIDQIASLHALDELTAAIYQSHSVADVRIAVEAALRVK